MKFDEKLIRHLEALSRIDLTAEERARFGEQLQKIVDYIEQLQGIDTEGIDPTTAVVVGASSSLRSDDTTPSLERARVLDEAPDSKDGYYRVPRIIDRQDP